jgi:hypothetical protein
VGEILSEQGKYMEHHNANIGVQGDKTSVLNSEFVANFGKHGTEATDEQPKAWFAPDVGELSKDLKDLLAKSAQKKMTMN